MSSVPGLSQSHTSAGPTAERRLDDAEQLCGLLAIPLWIDISAGGGVIMARLGVTVVLISTAVCGAVAVMVIFLAKYASQWLWLVLPTAGILAGMGIFLSLFAWRASRPQSSE